MIEHINYQVIGQGIILATVLGVAKMFRSSIKERIDDISNIGKQLFHLEKRLDTVVNSVADLKSDLDNFKSEVRADIVGLIASDKLLSSRIDVLVDAQLAKSDYTIKSILYTAEDRGGITELEYQTAHNVYKQYKAMGGNGAIAGCMAKIDELFKHSKHRTVDTYAQI